MYIVYGGEVLNMSILDINKHRRKLKVLCFKNRHKTIYQPLGVSLRKMQTQKKNDQKITNFLYICNLWT
jgi:hypothetical protein